MSMFVKDMHVPAYNKKFNGGPMAFHCILYINPDNSVELSFMGKTFPITNIPVPHGDLIDREILNECCEELMSEPASVAVVNLTAAIGQANPVIEAERSEHDG